MPFVAVPSFAVPSFAPSFAQYRSRFAGCFDLFISPASEARLGPAKHLALDAGCRMCYDFSAGGWRMNSRRTQRGKGRRNIVVRNGVRWTPYMAEQICSSRVSCAFVLQTTSWTSKFSTMNSLSSSTWALIFRSSLRA